MKVRLGTPSGSEIFMEKVFGESCYDEVNCNFYCDAGCDLKRIGKTVSFGELRKEVFISGHYCYDEQDIKPIMNHYLRERVELKDKNRRLRAYIHKRGKVKLGNLLEDHDCIDFKKKMPKCFKVIVKDARFINYDGNSKSVLCDCGDYYYYYSWNGS